MPEPAGSGICPYNERSIFLICANSSRKLIKALFVTVGVLFVVYFWNLDQKLLGWAYKQVNLIFDRKKVDQVF